MKTELTNWERIHFDNLLKTCRFEKKEFDYFEKKVDENGKSQIWAVCKDETRYGTIKSSRDYSELLENYHYSPKELGL